MTSVNELNERTRNQRIRDDFGALLIAVYRLPLEQRKVVLEQFEMNRRTAIAERLKPEYDCETVRTLSMTLLVINLAQIVSGKTLYKTSV